MKKLEKLLDIFKWEIRNFFQILLKIYLDDTVLEKNLVGGLFLLSKKGKIVYLYQQRYIILYDIHYNMLFYIINKEVYMDKNLL